MMRADENTGRGILSAVGAKESEGVESMVMRVTTHGRMKDAADRMIADHRVRDVGQELMLGRVTRMMEAGECQSRVLSTSLEAMITTGTGREGDVLVRMTRAMRATGTGISTIGLGLTRRVWTPPKVITVRIREEEW